MDGSGTIPVTCTAELPPSPQLKYHPLTALKSSVPGKDGLRETKLGEVPNPTVFPWNSLMTFVEGSRNSTVNGAFGLATGADITRPNELIALQS